MVEINYNPHDPTASEQAAGFTDSDQKLDNADSRAVTLGDSDGDGDLDAVIGNEVWLIDDGGIFR